MRKLDGVGDGDGRAGERDGCAPLCVVVRAVEIGGDCVCPGMRGCAPESRWRGIDALESRAGG
jgi:hypothetical protein